MKAASKETVSEMVAYDYTSDFYDILRLEVVQGNSALTNEEQAQLQSHYHVMMNPGKNPIELVRIVYANRRYHPVKQLMTRDGQIVLDAGCGYGSESFLFASLGAKVFAVDFSEKQVEIAKKRQVYYEKRFGKKLNIHFAVSDLNKYVPSNDQIDLTWFASVFAAIEDQERLLTVIYENTKPEGQIMITDMNLANPLFFSKELLRRERAKKRSPEFARRGNFLRMLFRHGRKGAIYYPTKSDKKFDDVQFFTANTLEKLLTNVGFNCAEQSFSGFLPPFLYCKCTSFLERVFSKSFFLKYHGYFYHVSAKKITSY